MKKSTLSIMVAGAIFSLSLSAQANIEVEKEENIVIEHKVFGSQSEELMEAREDFLLKKDDAESQDFEMLNMISPNDMGEGYTLFT